MRMSVTEWASRTAPGVWVGAGLLAFFVAGCAATPQFQPPLYASQEVPTTAASEPATQPVAPETQPAPTTEMSATAPAPMRQPETGMRRPFESGGSYSGEVVRAPETEQFPLRFALTGSYLYGPISGFTQIPAGGRGGTTSASRPKIKDLGIDTASIGDGELSVGIPDAGEFFFGGQYIHLSGSSRLERPLVTHGVSFPKDINVSSDLQLDWYRVGYRYPVVLSQTAEGRPDLLITPWIEAIFWDFSYDINGGSNGSASRSFTKPGIQVGGEFVWRPGGGPFSLEAQLGSFPQLSSVVQISVERAIARYHFYQWKQFDISAHLGVEWEQQNFKDNQRTSNHISADFGPMLITGLQVNF
jgi:hypothetical protein